MLMAAVSFLVGVLWIMRVLHASFLTSLPVDHYLGGIQPVLICGCLLIWISHCPIQKGSFPKDHDWIEKNHRQKSSQFVRQRSFPEMSPIWNIFVTMKTNMTGSKISISNRKYIDSFMVDVPASHGSFRGEGYLPRWMWLKESMFFANFLVLRYFYFDLHGRWANFGGYCFGNRERNSFSPKTTKREWMMMMVVHVWLHEHIIVKSSNVRMCRFCQTLLIYGGCSSTSSWSNSS